MKIDLDKFEKSEQVDDNIIRTNSYFLNNYVHEMKTLEYTTLKLFRAHA